MSFVLSSLWEKTTLVFIATIKCAKCTYISLNIFLTKHSREKIGITYWYIFHMMNANVFVSSTRYSVEHMRYIIYLTFFAENADLTLVREVGTVCKLQIKVFVQVHLFYCSVRCWKSSITKKYTFLVICCNAVLCHTQLVI